MASFLGSCEHSSSHPGFVSVCDARRSFVGNVDSLQVSKPLVCY